MKLKLLLLLTLLLFGITQPMGEVSRNYPFANPLYESLYYPKPPPKKTPSDKFLGALKSVGDAFEDAANTVADTFKSLGEDFYNKAIKPAYTAIYEKALIPIKNVATDLADRVKSCGFLTQDSSDLAARFIAKNVAQGVLIAAEQTAKGTLTAASGATTGIMIGSKGVLEGVHQTAQGVLIGAEASANSILEAVKIVTEEVLDSFKITRLHYHGDLQNLAKGNLGNVACKAKILSQEVNFKFDLNAKKATESIEKVVKQIVNKMKDEIEGMVKVIG